MQFKDYYALLGLSRDASVDDIKKACRRLARKYDTDVSKEPDAVGRMSEINEANAVLSDPQRRAAYDAIGAGHRNGERFTPPPDWDAGFGFSRRGAESMNAGEYSDFLAELFGRIERGARRQTRGTYRGQDLPGVCRLPGVSEARAR